MKRFLLRASDSILCVLGVLFLLHVGTRICELMLFSHLSAPDSVKNIEDFRQWNPSFTETEIVTFQGSTYYAVKGPFARFLPSTQSEYYFDHNGNYVGRNIDPGDVNEPAIFTARDTRRRAFSIKDIPLVKP